MELKEKNTILGKIIVLAEALEHSQLETKKLEETQSQLKDVSEYLGVDDMSAIFFSIIFVLQNQNSQTVTLRNIAEYLDYSFLYILSYRKQIDILENKNLIYLQKSKRTLDSDGNGYKIPETVVNNVINGEPILYFEKAEVTIDSIIREICMIQKSYSELEMDEVEYKRQISVIENKYKEKEFMKNVYENFEKDFDSRLIIYYIAFSLLFGSEILEMNRKLNHYESAVFDVLPAPGKSVRRTSLLDNTDILITQNFLRRVSFESDEYFRRKPMRNITFVLTSNGIQTFFGSEAENYQVEDVDLSDTDKTMNFLSEFSETYEDPAFSRAKKRSELSKLERDTKNLLFIAKINELLPLANDRFFLYDCVSDFTQGEKSSLCSTLNDLYGRSDLYFDVLRAFLDEKHILIKNDFLLIEKDEVIEKTAITITDKTIELLYGEHADLYIKRVSDRNIVMPEKLKEKELFYSPSVQKQIDILMESFEQNKLEEMQARLEKKGLPKGIAVILYGAPGTGKTETVYQLARKTNRKILHVDISESKSMWFGESEKKIKRIFTDYRKLCTTCKNHKENTPILLFNEADALISKRRDIESSSCSATENAMQNILLEELEKLDGILIATTNLCDNMDSAFERRFLFKVKYEKPTLAERERIWLNKMPSLTELDVRNVADRFLFSGGEIDNIVRKCEINEIIHGKKIDIDELIELCKEEKLQHSGDRHIGF